MNNINLSDIFNKTSINDRAKENWNFKSEVSRIRASNKYKHIFKEKNIAICDWNNIFENLSRPQQVLLIKSELIRTYDALPNIDKTKIKAKFNLSSFATKWYKLSSSDKNKLLKYVL